MLHLLTYPAVGTEQRGNGSGPDDASANDSLGEAPVIDAALRMVTRLGGGIEVASQSCQMMVFGLARFDGRSIDASALERLGDDPGDDDVGRWASSLRGQFLIVLSFPQEEKVFVITDRASSLPVYWCQKNGVTGVAPETMTLAQWRGEDLTLRRDALFEFMASGHLWGDGTYWNEIQRIGPGRVMKMDSRGVTIFPYWEMRIDSSRLSWADAEEKLRAAISADMDALGEGKGLLTLSGGYDSRALLGLMHQAGRDFETISYSFGDEFAQGYDLEVGTHFANKLGVKHHIYHADITDTDRVIRDFEACVRITGGEADTATAQDVMLGESFYRDLGSQFDFMIRGDETWGWGDRVVSKGMALWQVLLFNLDQITGPRRLLRPAVFTEGVAALSARHSEMLTDAGDRHPCDIKDYLYWRQREARIIQVMRHYCRRFVPHYAPFLFGESMEVVRTLPVPMRSRKRLFRQTMDSMFPDLFLDDQTAPTKKTPTRSRFHKLHEQPAYKAYLRHVLIEQPPDIWFELFDRKAFEQWFDQTTSPPGEVKVETDRKYDLGRKAYDLLRRSEWSLGAVMALGLKTGRLRFPTRSVTYLNRLLTLASVLKLAEKTSGAGLSTLGESMTLSQR